MSSGQQNLSMPFDTSPRPAAMNSRETMKENSRLIWRAPFDSCSGPQTNR